MLKRVVFGVLAVTSFLMFEHVSLAQNSAEPRWDPRVIGSREFREIIQETPIELRPYRPLHFYGNTVRRDVYRGTPWPMPKDWFQMTTVGLTPRVPNSNSTPRVPTNNSTPRLFRR